MFLALVHKHRYRSVSQVIYATTLQRKLLISQVLNGRGEIQSLVEPGCQYALI
jgi:hypothetical protein